MGKLMDNLKKQLKTEYKKEAQDCIKIYYFLKEVTGSVWESNWDSLTRMKWENNERVYSPNEIGKVLLTGIESNKN
jgi:hypothetical protein